MVSFADWMLPTPAEIACVLDAAAGGPVPAKDLVQGIPAGPRRILAFRGLVWLVKMHALQCVLEENTASMR